MNYLFVGLVVMYAAFILGIFALPLPHNYIDAKGGWHCTKTAIIKGESVCVQYTRNEEGK